MSKLIITIEAIFVDFFGEVHNALTGKYITQNEGAVELMNELKNTKIPTAREDRENLRKDGANVARDYKKALEFYEY